jgi:hypothetical protein
MASRADLVSSFELATLSSSTALWLRTARLFWSSEDWGRAFEKARSLSHPDAVWLTALFPSRTPPSPAQARAVLLQQPESGRSCFFAAVACRPWDSGLKLRAAELGYPLAQALLSIAALHDREAQFRWARAAADQGDPVSIPKGRLLLGLNLFSAWHDASGRLLRQWLGLQAGSAQVVAAHLAERVYGRRAGPVQRRAAL